MTINEEFKTECDEYILMYSNIILTSVHSDFFTRIYCNILLHQNKLYKYIRIIVHEFENYFNI